MSTPPAATARPMLCSDAEGRDLVITIRLAPDGSVYLHDIPPDFVPIAAALAPQDPDLARRAAILARKASQP
ncbi:hypothetical protein PHYC_03119 [Phycisphaerales bacterium]|nr:hypothetical protein PHYC_03119 [Phycisphaerales bacterium]